MTEQGQIIGAQILEGEWRPVLKVMSGQYANGRVNVHRDRCHAVLLTLVDDARAGATAGAAPVQVVEFEAIDVIFEQTGPRRVLDVRPPDVAASVWQQPTLADPLGPRRTRNTADRLYHNPYNFVPACPPAKRAEDAPAWDGHDRLHDDNVSGYVDVTMTVRTPVLAPDATGADAAPVRDGGKHLTFATRRRHDGTIDLDPAGVKGALRAAYEAITQSRFGVFEAHDEPLGVRSLATADRVPVRIVAVDGTLHAEVMAGFGTVGAAGVPDTTPHGPDPCLHAAWVRSYRPGTNHAVAPGLHLQHRAAVSAWVRRSPMPFRVRGRPLQRWQVVAIAPAGGVLNTPADRRPDDQQIEGFFFRSGWNIDGKHDEKVFFHAPGPQHPQRLPLQARHLAQWTQLIADYNALHTDHPPTNEGVDWSAHIGNRSWSQLTHGDLAWARIITKQGGAVELVDLAPVQISRLLHPRPPREFLHTTFRPATMLDELSPADRVFGWVAERPSPTGHNALRGRVRIEPLDTPDVPEPVGTPDHGLALAPLGQPKPAQARFYLGRGDASAQSDSTEHESLFKTPVWSEERTTAAGPGYADEEASAGYDDPRQKALRGWKVYPHHASLPDGYWDTPAGGWVDAPGRVGERHRDYLMPQHLQPDTPRRGTQNRSVKDWVPPGATFTFRVWFDDVRPDELGALLWLLDLPPDDQQRPRHHRIGGGKPHGFGSVTMTITHHALENGTAARDRWMSWPPSSGEPTERTPSDVVDTLIGQFQAAARTANSATTFDEIPHIRAWLRSATGFTDGLPIHPPRTGEQRLAPSTTGYEWFTRNERDQAVEYEHAERHRRGLRRELVHGYTLADLVDSDGHDDSGLPYLPQP